RRAERFHARRAEAVQQPGAQARAAQVAAQHVVRQRQGRRRAVDDVDDECLAEVAACWHAGQPPASADMKKTVSPCASGVHGSLVILSPFSAAVTCRSNGRPTAAATAATVAALTVRGPAPRWPDLARAPNSWTVTAGAGRSRAFLYSSGVLTFSTES